MDRRTAACGALAMSREMSRIAPSLLKTMTHDQDSEMARHQEITVQTGMKMYFANLDNP